MSDSHDSAKTDVHPGQGLQASAGPKTLDSEMASVNALTDADEGEAPDGPRMDVEDVDGVRGMHGGEGRPAGVDGEEAEAAGLDFDPDTLATLTALSSMQEGGDDDETDAGDIGEGAATEGDGLDTSSGEPAAAPVPAAAQKHSTSPIISARPTASLPSTRPTGASASVSASSVPSPQVRFAPTESVPRGSSAALADSEEEASGRSDGDAEYKEPRYVVEDGRLKRKRNRSVVSCTECHRRKQQCDRKVPCNRCVARGLGGMCKMELPPARSAKKKYIPLAQRATNVEESLRAHTLDDLYRAPEPGEAAEAVSGAAINSIVQAVRQGGGDTTRVKQVIRFLLARARGEGDGAGTVTGVKGETLADIMAYLNSMYPKPSRPFAANMQVEEVLVEGPDPWSTVPTAKWQSVAALTAAYTADPSQSKLNLMLPGFREDNGNIFLPPTVQYVEKKMREQSLLSREALPIQGDEAFLDLGLRFGYGADCDAYKQGRISSVQTSTIQSALRLGCTFLSRFPPSAPTQRIYLPQFTLPEDETIIRAAGLQIAHYRLFDKKTGEVDWEGMKSDLEAAPPKSAVMLHISGSMPMGVDPSVEQWRSVNNVLLSKKLVPFALLAFQGLASGDADKDALPLRSLVKVGLPVLLVQNFDAMMGLHADSPTIMSVVTQHADTKKRVDTQLRNLARQLLSSPSPWGSHIVRSIMAEPKLQTAWLNEIKAMSLRLKSVREKLYNLLTNKLDTPGTWTHFKTGVGMYCSTLLTLSQTEALARRHHIYLLPNACLSLGALNAPRIEALARAIDVVVRDSIRETEEAEEQRLAIDYALKVAREAAAREEAEEASQRELQEAQMAQEEDQLLMERSIQSAMDAQRLQQEEQERQEEEQRKLEEAVAKAAEKAELMRRAEEILNSMSM